ncbi:CelD/BcsL family acetyltransferase involved in cellulose biosynthesis [Paraburkholderia sp. GAS333]|uniref:GNAT family N-acetyltransferase n=1 Tax=Paraburkholderia sp. GAS333 TaxID=3156279 RepID=UPI003D1BDC13
MAAGTTEIVVVSNPADFQSLQAEWDELWNEANGLHYQAFSVCWSCWTEVAKPQGKNLRCIVYRENGKLLLVWPLVSHRRLLWRVLNPLTPGTIEHTSMLVAQGSHTRRAIASAWEAALKRCGGDALMVPYVGVGTALHQHASRHARVMTASSDVAMIATFPRDVDWDTFCVSLGPFEKKRPGARLRKLSKEGELVARRLGQEDSDSFDRWVDWMMERKREWASRKGMASTWLAGSTYRNYLIALLNSTDAQSKGHLYVLTLDGVPVAATIVGMGKTCMTGLMGAFDQSYAKFEPGQIVREMAIKDAFDLGLDIDLGVGTERFKAYWSRQNIVSNESFEIAASPVGVLAFHVKRLIHAAKTRRKALPSGVEPASPAGTKSAHALPQKESDAYADHAARPVGRESPPQFGQEQQSSYS